jgi:hypothetical protein
MNKDRNVKNAEDQIANLDHQAASADELMSIVVVLTVIGSLVMIGIAALTGAFSV